MKLEQARKLAKEWVGILQASCTRIDIAGSVRREKPEVHDIEIVAAPKQSPQVDLFERPIGNLNLLELKLCALCEEGACEVIKGGPKYKQIALPEGINIDLFIVTPPAEYGVIQLIRTGPADFSRWIVTRRNQGGGLPSCARVKDGAVWVADAKIPMRDERDFLEFCELGWIEPWDRKPNPVRWRQG